MVEQKLKSPPTVLASMEPAVLEKLEVPTSKRKTEMVESKGIGHPDTMADSIAETFSRNLCKAYEKEFGEILHHNVDKLDIVGGETVPKF